MRCLASLNIYVILLYTCIYVILLYAAVAAKSLQSCPTLCGWPHRQQPPGSPVPGILQARTLEWVAISFSNAWKYKVKEKLLSRVWLSRPHGLQPTRLLHPWEFPGKSTGVGCHCLLQILLYTSVYIYIYTYTYIYILNIISICRSYILQKVSLSGRVSALQYLQTTIKNLYTFQKPLKWWNWWNIYFSMF